MRKSNVTIGELADRGFMRQGQAVREVIFNAPADLPIVDLVELYVEIESALANDRGSIVQFVSATGGCDSEQITLDVAWIGASILGKRVLLLDCTKPQREGIYGEETDPTFEAPTLDPVAVDGDMVKVAGQEMYLADLRTWHARASAMAAADEIDRRLNELCTFFDMIILAAPAADGNPFGTVMARHVDGNVVVLEAERTRRSAAIRLRETLARSGRPIVGAILNNRRTYIPRWLARFF